MWHQNLGFHMFSEGKRRLSLALCLLDRGRWWRKSNNSKVLETCGTKNPQLDAVQRRPWLRGLFRARLAEPSSTLTPIVRTFGSRGPPRLTPTSGELDILGGGLYPRSGAKENHVTEAASAVVEELATSPISLAGPRQAMESRRDLGCAPSPPKAAASLDRVLVAGLSGPVARASSTQGARLQPLRGLLPVRPCSAAVSRVPPRSESFHRKVRRILVCLTTTAADSDKANASTTHLYGGPSLLLLYL